jgi:ribA/ribD-fused uncharacterized protein
MQLINSFSGEYRFLSNFYSSPFEYSDRLWPTVEHFFAAMKTKNYEQQEEIRLASSPGQAKRLGRAVDLRSDWESAKLRVMRAGLQLKFAVGSELADRLLATRNAHLVEGNTWGDVFWGQVDGSGENWLGVLLINRRSELRVQSST